MKESGQPERTEEGLRWVIGSDSGRPESPSFHLHERISLLSQMKRIRSLKCFFRRFLDLAENDFETSFI